MRVFRLLLASVATFAVAAFAAAAAVRVSGPSIFVNGMEVVHLRASAAGRSPDERAQLLGQVLQANIGSGAARVSNSGKEVRIVVGEKPWLTVTPDDAKQAGSTPAGLAQAWAAAIQEALALPPVKAEVRQLKVPVGAGRSVRLVGSRIEETTSRSSDERVATATCNGTEVQIQAKAAGNAQVVLSAGGQSTTVDVSVRPVAAAFPQTLTAYVTGAPASRDTVAGALVAAVNSDLQAVDGAEADFKPPTVAEINTGESRSYVVRVHATGPEAFPSEGLVTVNVRNASIGYRSEAVLWYSNDPEPVKKPMNLFVAALKSGEPVRMLYHHINRSGGTLVMNVEAINNTATPARLLIIPGDADPHQNPVAAGFQAADRFVKAWQKYSGEIVDIPPNSILPISLRRMARNDTVSGLCYLRLLEGGPQQLVVRAQTRRPTVVSEKWKLAMASDTPWQIAGTKPIGDLASVPMPDTVHIYPDPFKREEVAYNVGGPYAFVRIGQTPIAREDNHGALDGNFGVLYTIVANIANNTRSSAEVEVVYEASAGYGGALFLIDGDLRRTPMLQPKEETQLSHFKLEPNSSKSLRIMTLPISGSAYPCTITIRAVQPGGGTTRPLKSN